MPQTEDNDTPAPVSECLSPCPFCGKSATLYSVAERASQFDYPDQADACAVCSGCEASVYGQTDEQAIAAWNTRHHATRNSADGVRDGLSARLRWLGRDLRAADWDEENEAAWLVEEAARLLAQPEPPQAVSSEVARLREALECIAKAYDEYDPARTIALAALGRPALSAQSSGEVG